MIQILLSAFFFFFLTVVKAASTTGDAQSPLLGQQQQHRRLPIDFNFNRIIEAFNRLFSTPPANWEAGQWVLFGLIVFTILYCCGCIAGNRRRRNNYNNNNNNNGYGSGYGGQYPGSYGAGGGFGNGGYGRSSGGGGGGGCFSCLRNILLCFCCYELFCGDCQEVPCFRHSRFGGDENFAYRGDIV